MHITFPLLFAVTIIYLAVMVVINRRLKIQHPKEWNQLGRPSLWNNSPANGIRFLRFVVFSSDHKALQDPKLDTYSLLEKILFMLWLALFIVSASLFFARVK